MRFFKGKREKILGVYIESKMGVGNRISHIVFFFHISRRRYRDLNLGVPTKCSVIYNYFILMQFTQIQKRQKFLQKKKKGTELLPIYFNMWRWKFFTLIFVDSTEIFVGSIAYSRLPKSVNSSHFLQQCCLLMVNQNLFENRIASAPPKLFNKLEKKNIKIERMTKWISVVSAWLVD